MSSTQLLPDCPDDRDTAKFLRRFSELISVGQSASYLRHAAGLIDELAERLRQTEDLLREQTVAATKNLALRDWAQAELQTAQLELEQSDEALADERERARTAEAGFAEQRQELAERLASSEAQLADVSRELQRLQSKFAAVGDTHIVVPIAILNLLRAQFAALAAEFDSRGDLVSGAMCEVGICRIDRSLADEPAETA
jgi:hypothetical protein